MRRYFRSGNGRSRSGTRHISATRAAKRSPFKMKCRSACVVGIRRAIPANWLSVRGDASLQPMRARLPKSESLLVPRPRGRYPAPASSRQQHAPHCSTPGRRTVSGAGPTSITGSDLTTSALLPSRHFDHTELAVCRWRRLHRHRYILMAQPPPSVNRKRPQLGQSPPCEYAASGKRAQTQTAAGLGTSLAESLGRDAVLLTR